MGGGGDGRGGMERGRMERGGVERGGMERGGKACMQKHGVGSVVVMAIGNCNWQFSVIVIQLELRYFC